MAQQEKETSSRSLKPLGKVLPYVLRYKGLVGGAVVFLFVAAVTTLILPMAVRRMIDSGFSNSDSAFINRYFMMLMVLAVVLAAASALRYYFVITLGERIVAAPGDDHYGRLGVLAGWLTHAEMMFDLSPQAFTPPPKVTSTVVHLEPRLNPLPCDLGKLERVTAAAFGQRRKMLRQSLKSLGGEALLQKAGIDPSRRAETLSVEEFCRIANLLP